MKYLKIIVLTAVIAVSGCDYLDIMPDNVPTMNHAFSNQASAERFLFSCYNYLPNHASLWYPGRISGDELWWCRGSAGREWDPHTGTQIAQGNQNANDPYFNYWGGRREGKNMYIGLRDCNIFLENIHIPSNIEEWERTQWIAEVKVLKAYFHFFLMQLYGPIPIIRENLPVNADPGTTMRYREPVDDVVDYIVELIDEALPDLLPNSFYTRELDAGRITQPIAAAIKAKALVLAASPLFNGNPDYADFKDKRGVQLVSSTDHPQKWERAALAVQEAIGIAMENGHALFEYVPGSSAQLSETTLQKAMLRGAITEKYNQEIIWASPNNTNDIQHMASPFFSVYTASYYPSEFGPTLKIAEEFYTQNGLPIDEDEEWLNWLNGDFSERYNTLAASTNNGSGWDGVSSLSEDHRYYIQSNGTTARLHYYREPRFYAWIGFDRGIYELNGENETNRVMRMLSGELNGASGGGRYTPTGYNMKKLVHMETVQASSGSFTWVRYTIPIIRLTDLFLLYAEALNEMKSTPDAEVYHWINLVRERAGIPGVLEAYEKAVAQSRNKPFTKNGMREIIKRERLIELSFESERYFDIIRWKDGVKYFNEPVRGWNMYGTSADSFYQIVTLHNLREFTYKDYLWPIRIYDLQVNSNLVQNPGW